MLPLTKERRATPASCLKSGLRLAAAVLAFSSTCDEGFDIWKTACQSASHPFCAGVSNQHVVFDAHADAFVLFERGLYGRNEFLVLGRLRQIVQGIRTNVNAWFVREHHAWFEYRAATNVMNIHTQPM